MRASFVLRTKVNPAPTIAPCKMDSVWTGKHLFVVLIMSQRTGRKFLTIFGGYFISMMRRDFIYSLRLGGKLCLLIGVRVQAGSWA
jgi:hypothetical protein